MDQQTLDDFSGENASDQGKALIRRLEGGGSKIFICAECGYETESRQGLGSHCTQLEDHDPDDVIKPILISELQDLAKKLERTPTQSDTAEHDIARDTTYASHFGSWNDALAEAGLDVNKRNNIPEEELLRDLRNLAEKLGKPPTQADANKHDIASTRTYQLHFGSWNEALQQAGLDVNREVHVPEEELIEEIERVYNELGHPPTEEEFNQIGRYYSDIYWRRFGSYNKALEKIGVQLNKNTNFGREDLVEELIEVADEVGGTPTQDDFNRVSSFGVGTIQREFGSWNAGLDEAELDLNNRVNIPAAELIDDLQRVADEYGEPLTSPIYREHGQFGIGPIVDRFGSWNEALREASLEVGIRRDIPEEELIEDLKRVADDIGSPPTVETYRRHGQFSLAAFQHHFGTWNNAIQQSGQSVNKISLAEAEEVLNDIKTVADKIGETPTIEQYNEHGKFAYSTVHRLFGSWNSGLREADLPVKKRFDIDHEKVLSDLKRVADEIGHSPHSFEYNNIGEYSASTVANLFGSWNSGLQEAGLSVNAAGSTYADPDHLDHFVRSSWELEIANLLTDIGVDYEYEALAIEYGEERVYNPDFVTENYVIEVKGRIFEDGKEVKKANAAMEQLSEREYVVIGTDLPADHHIGWGKREKEKDRRGVRELFGEIENRKSA